jgi:hypothetical protein
MSESRQSDGNRPSVTRWEQDEKSAWVALWGQLNGLLQAEEGRIVAERKDRKKLSDKDRSECMLQEKSAIDLLKEQLTLSENSTLQREQAKLAEEAVRRFLLMIDSLKHEGLVIKRNTEGSREVKIMEPGEQGGARLVTMTEKTKLLYGAPNNTFFEAVEGATFAAKKAGKIFQIRAEKMKKLGGREAKAKQEVDDIMAAAKEYAAQQRDTQEEMERQRLEREQAAETSAREEKERTEREAQNPAAAAEAERQRREAARQEPQEEEDAHSVAAPSATLTTHKKEIKWKDEYLTLGQMLKDYITHLDEWAKKRGCQFTLVENEGHNLNDPQYILKKMADPRSHKMRDLTETEQKACLDKFHATNALLRSLEFPTFTLHSQMKTHEEMIKTFFGSEDTQARFAILRQRRREDSVLAALLRRIDWFLKGIGLGRFTPVGVHGRVTANRAHHFAHRLEVNHTKAVGSPVPKKKS